MKYKQLTPIQINNRKVIEIKNSIVDYLKETFFKIIENNYNEFFNKKIIINSISNELKKRIESGELELKGNEISGKFNSRIVKELKKIGGEFKKNKFIFSTLPIDLINIKYNLSKKLNSFVDGLKSSLNDYLEILDKSIDLCPISYKDTIDLYKKQIDNSFKEFSITADINEDMRNVLNKNYIDDTKLYIKKWMFEDVSNMRKDIEKYVFEDGLSDKAIADIIQENYNTTQKKAMFLARQESSLLLSEYTKNEYLQVGITKWKWGSSRDERVRPYHKKLDGMIFNSMVEPPIDDENGNRHFPACNYSCRCVMIPLLT